MACDVIVHMGDEGMIRPFLLLCSCDSTGSIHTLDTAVKDMDLLWAYEQQSLGGR